MVNEIIPNGVFDFNELASPICCLKRGAVCLKFQNYPFGQRTICASHLWYHSIRNTGRMFLDALLLHSTVWYVDVTTVTIYCHSHTIFTTSKHYWQHFLRSCRESLNVTRSVHVVDLMETRPVRKTDSPPPNWVPRVMSIFWQGTVQGAQHKYVVYRVLDPLS